MMEEDDGETNGPDPSVLEDGAGDEVVTNGIVHHGD